MSLKIHTTQNVTLNFREAGLGPRILARILDGVFIALWVLGGLIIIFRINSSDAAFTLFFLVIALPVVFYDLVFEIFNKGQSPGKMIMKIRVVNLDGTTPSVGSYLIRWLFRLIDFTLTSGALAVLMVAFTDKSQRLGDYLAGTTVISLKDEIGSQTLSIPDLDFYKDYQVAYPDVLEKLSDKDVNTIRSLLNDYRYYNDEYTIKQLSDKIKSVTSYEYEGSDRAFLKKIIDDYTYLSLQ
ncbi:MAG: RDD family protein [Dysgonomonas sp.]